MAQPRLPTEDLEHILAHTRDDWENLRDQRLFITGGTGFFGKWLLESFAYINEKLSLGAEAVVLSRDPEAFLEQLPHLRGQAGLSFHRGDVRDFAFPPGKFPWIVSGATAASARMIAEQPLLMFDTILQGTRRTLDFAAKCGAKRVFLTSSGAVYGRQPSEIAQVDEDYRGAPVPTDPGVSYGEAKRAAEVLCATYAREHGFEAAIARCYAFVGPHLPLDTHFAIGNFIRDGLQGRAIQVNGDGTPYRSYLYASDLAIWLWTILFRGTSCRPYNVGSPDGFPISGIAKSVAGCLDGIPVQIARPADPSKPAERYVPSVHRAERELGLKVRIGLEEAIRKTLAWHRQNPQKTP